ncbi:hypothetical protein NW754_005994 [Fusarium falciforme]|nr:hypothetical protein NW754_005994 [Fusarium falciforme]
MTSGGPGNRVQGAQVSQRMHGAIHHDAYESKGDEQGCGPAVGQDLAAGDKETGADAAGDGNQL